MDAAKRDDNICIGWDDHISESLSGLGLARDVQNRRMETKSFVLGVSQLNQDFVKTSSRRGF